MYKRCFSQSSTYFKALPSPIGTSKHHSRFGIAYVHWRYNVRCYVRTIWMTFRFVYAGRGAWREGWLSFVQLSFDVAH